MGRNGCADGRQKNVSIMASELERAFRSGIAIDASAIPGFGGEVRSDLLLHPEPETLAELPWRPENGKVVLEKAGQFVHRGSSQLWR